MKHFPQKKKKMSKHVRNVTKVSHLMRNSERKKLWKSTHFKVGLRIFKKTIYIPAHKSHHLLLQLDGCVSFQWGEQKCLNIKTEIISSSTFDLDVYYTWASPHSKTFGERDWTIEFYSCRRNRLNEIVDLAGKLEDWKRTLGKWSRFWNCDTTWWSFSQQ